MPEATTAVPEAPPARREPTTRWMLGVLALLLVLFIVVQVLGLVIGAVPALVLAELGVLATGALLFARRRGGWARTFPLHRPSARGWLGVALAGLGLAGVQGVITRLMMTVIPGGAAFLAQVEQAFAPMKDLPLPVGLAVMAVVPAFAEELLFRGLVFNALQPERRPLRALLLSSVLFGLFHLSPHHVLLATTVGGVLGWVRARTGSMLPSMALHALNNTVSLLVFHQLVPDDRSWSLPAIGGLLALGAAGAWVLTTAPTTMAAAAPPAPEPAAAR